MGPREPMQLIKALALSLGELPEPVVTQYHLGLVLYGLYLQKEFRGQPLDVHKERADRGDFARYLKQLQEDGILEHPKGLPDKAYTLLGTTHWTTEAAACAMDPFCYISHLSAMAHHGLTDRLPSRLFISSPATKSWRTHAEEKMRKDLGTEYEQYCSNGLPLITRIRFEKIGKVPVHCFNSSHLGAFKHAPERPVRVATIGRTFLDMLRNPELCGGINHVIDVFTAYGNQYLRLITDEIEQHGRPIDKVRAGYILEERAGIENTVVASWIAFAQRGGSRKLDPAAEYVPQWSDRWCISINIFEKAG